MDGRKPLLRNLFIASLALAGQASASQADDVIRQPSKSAQVRTPARDDGTLSKKVETGSVPATGVSVELIEAPIARLVGVRPKLASTGASRALPDGRSKIVLQANSAAESVDTDTASQSKSLANSFDVNTPPPASIEPGPGWQAVGEDLKNHLRRCEELLSRKAYLSAREESTQAIIQLVRVLDLRQNRFTCEPAWAQAQQALRESQEFTSLERIANDAELFTRLIQAHETPVLRDANVAEMTPLAAAQHYRAYAEKRLVEASLGHPWFSELYYCMGRSLQSQAESSQRHSEALLQQALTFYRASCTIQPSNATNANQLGYVLLRMDRPTEALEQLSEVVRLPTCPLEAWQNMAEASSRMGDKRSEQWAIKNYLALKSQGVQPSGPTGTLVEVDPRQFAAMSPRTSGPGALAPNVNATTVSTVSETSSTQSSAGAAPNNGPADSNRTATTPRFGIFR